MSANRVPTPHVKLAATLCFGFAGALAATALDWPAAALVGATLVVSCGSLCRLTRDVPAVLRDAGFTIIGLSLGSGMTREAVAQAAHWPLSIATLTIAVLLIMAGCGLMLVRCFGHSAETSMLATSPGALGYIMALTAEGHGDAPTVVVVQSIRLFLVTALLPLILERMGLRLPHTQSANLPVMGAVELLVILAVSFLVGWVLQRGRMPAGFFISGIITSSIAHYAGLVSGGPPAALLFIGFAITGTMVGARFSTIPLADFKRLFSASLAVLLLSCLISGLFAYPIAVLLDVPYGQVFVAFAPGGVEAMAAMAISLGFDPTFVAVHHLYRILLLIAVMTWFLKRKWLER